jgi:hypothetical protein
LADDPKLRKGEPSRWEAGGVGHYPSMSTHKLRQQAAAGFGELQAVQQELARVQRTEPEDPTKPLPRRVTTLEEVTHGLGLDQADAQRVQRVVADTNPSFTVKTQTQRIFHARGRFLSFMRDSMRHIPSDKREELLKRAVAYWQHHYQTDYGKAPTARYGEVRRSMEHEPLAVITVGKLLKGPPKLVVDPLYKGPPRGGKYYRRVPYTDGKGNKRYRYFYSKEEYERAKGDEAHPNGQEEKKRRETAQALMGTIAQVFARLEAMITGAGTPPKPAQVVRSEKKAVVAELKAKGPAAAKKRLMRALATSQAALQREVGRVRYDQLEEQSVSALFPSKPGDQPAPQPKLVVPAERPQPQQLGLDFTDAAPQRGAAEAVESGQVPGVEHEDEGQPQPPRPDPSPTPEGSPEPVEPRVREPGYDPNDPSRIITEATQWGSWTNMRIRALSLDEAAEIANQASDLVRATGNKEAGQLMNRLREAHGKALGKRMMQLRQQAKPAPPTPEPTPEPRESEPGWERFGEQEAATPFNKPPPGGWTEEDKVPRDPERDQRMAEMRERLAARQEQFKRVRFQTGQQLTINGKQYEVTKTDDEIMRDAPTMVAISGKRVVHLKPLGRATKPRELYIDKKGNATIYVFGSNQRSAVESIEGADTADEPWVFPEKPQPTPQPEPPKTTPSPPKAPPDTPRGEAEAETKRMVDEGEYINARESAVGNRGEDLLGSARHKALEWKNLGDALRSDDAEKLFTRKFLEKQEPPPNMIAAVQQGTDPITAMVAQLCFNKFPSKPVIGTFAQAEWKAQQQRMYPDPRRGGPKDPPKDEADHKQRQRAGYYEAYQKAKDVTASLVASGQTDPRELAKDALRGLDSAMDEMARKHGSYSTAYEVLRRMYNGIAGRGANTPLNQVARASKEMRKRHPDNPTEYVAALREVAMQVLEGKTVAAAAGMQKTRRGGPTTQEILRRSYNTDNMVRRGPPSRYQSDDQALNMLTEHSVGEDGDEAGRFGGGGELGGESVFGMRGLQWGNSVTDDERRHHTKALVDSFADLLDVTGLPPQMASFNGKLGMAVGARGKGGAMAHYEPDTQIINLTRKNGAGSLAHEWGHFFDYTMGKVGGTPSGNAVTIDVGMDGGHAVQQAMRDLMVSDSFTDFRHRMGDVAMLHHPASEKKRAYWKSRDEMFARCFERYVQKKLRDNGRENTYLVGVTPEAYDPKEGFWPTDSEIDGMAPYFDKLLQTFRESELLEKAIAYLDSLSKGGGNHKYYKREPKPGGGYRYYYSKDEYDRSKYQERVKEADAQVHWGRHGEQAAEAQKAADWAKDVAELALRLGSPKHHKQVNEVLSASRRHHHEPAKQKEFIRTRVTPVLRDLRSSSNQEKFKREEQALAKERRERWKGHEATKKSEGGGPLINPKYAHFVRPRFVVPR